MKMKVLAMLAILVGVCFMAVGASAHDNNGDHGGSPHEKVTLCHATASETNPYVTITVNVNSVADAQNVGGHGNHAGDIIPPYTYDDFTYPGQGDQSILANDCEVPVVPPVTDPTTIPSPTTTPEEPPTDPPTPTTAPVVTPPTEDSTPPTTTPHRCLACTPRPTTKPPTPSPTPGPVTPPTPTPSGQLPFTGSNHVSALLTLGLLFMGMGGVLLALTKARRGPLY